MEHGFRDLHVSGSEPRIFPGLVSHAKRRDSLKSQNRGNVEGPNRHNKRGSRSGLDGNADELREEEEDDEEGERESDEDAEEAGGMRDD
jgi:AMP deaminase